MNPGTPGSFPAFVEELKREVGLGHPLFGREAVAVARRQDCDDVLFFLPDGPAPLAVVHLTWRMQQEVNTDNQMTNANYPTVKLYSSFADWLENGMRKDHDLCQ